MASVINWSEDMAAIALEPESYSASLAGKNQGKYRVGKPPKPAPPVPSEPVFQGTVAKFNGEGMYGFIKVDLGAASRDGLSLPPLPKAQVFAHQSQVAGDATLSEGLRVAFQIERRLTN